MDKLKQERPLNDPFDLSPRFPPRGSSHGGSSVARSATLSTRSHPPIGSHLSSLSTAGNTRGPRIGLWSYCQSSYLCRQDGQQAESEFEDESAARMQSLVPSGLLHDDGRDHEDSFRLFPSPVEVPGGNNLNKENESRHEEFLRGGVHQSYKRNGFVEARSDQGFDSSLLSNHERVVDSRARISAGGHVPNPVGGHVQALAGRHVGQKSAGGHVQAPAGGHVGQKSAGGYFDQCLAEGYAQAPAEGYFQRIEAIRRARESALTASSEPIVASDNAEMEILLQHEGFRHQFPRGLANNSITQSSLLEKNEAVLINEAASLRNWTHEEDYPLPEAELETTRDKIFQVQWMKHMLNLLMLDLGRQAFTAEMSQRSGFSSPQPTSSVNPNAVFSTAVTSSHSVPATMHPAASRVRSRDQRQETSSVSSRSAGRSLGITPEKKPDGYRSNSYSPSRQTSASTSATTALIAQGAKSISVILKPDHSGSRGRSSHSASPLSPASNPVSPGSGPLSPLRPRRLNMSNIDGLQLIPVENPSLELDVCNQGQFKTELCNNWQESQWCRYGDHCRFAHGVKELRCVLRHHRYKSVPCRMIMSGKECIYGHRCHYRHCLTETEKELSLISEAKLVPRTTF